MPGSERSYGLGAFETKLKTTHHEVKDMNKKKGRLTQKISSLLYTILLFFKPNKNMNKKQKLEFKTPEDIYPMW